MFFFLTFYEPWCPRVTVASGVLRLEQGECCGFVPCLKTIKQKSNESAYFLLLLFIRVNNEMTVTNNKETVLTKKIFCILICLNLVSKNRKKTSTKSLYGGYLGTTSKIHLRPRGQTNSEQVKEIQKNLSFPLNSN